MTDDEWATTPFPQYTDQQEAEIIARSPIADVARELGIALGDRGDGNLIGACPWCRATEFVIYLGEGNWTCYGCLESGRDVLILVCKIRELWRADAVRWLEQRAAKAPTRTRIVDADIARVRELNPIGHIVGETVELADAGNGNLKGLCPFHTETIPSFHVTPARGYFYCFGCAEGGDVITFVRKIRDLGYTEAVEFLAAHAGVELTYEEGI